MSPLIIVILAVAAFASSALLTFRFCSPTSTVYILDHPNERSLHDRPVPRGGGLAVLVAIIVCGIVAGLLYPTPGVGEIAFAMLMVAGVSFIDDRYSVPPFYRLIAHVAAAAVILYGGFFLQRLEIPGAIWQWSHVVGALFSVLFIIWMINLYNFMDGMDGFAGGMTVMGFGTFAVLGLFAGSTLFSALNLIIVASTMGFLIFNFPPARIFMGDVGSSTLGFLAASMSLWAAHERVFPFWLAVLVFSPFIVDATVTLIRRLLRGEKIWQAHKTHYYQRLVQSGWGHRKTVLWEYAIMFGCGLTSIMIIRAPALVQITVLATWGLFYAGFFSWVSRHEVRSR
jgi:UDP-N-acetylmuramyl pentapeptide phosphotransferase/UDP-N-acetylglucosamine-1-phosphate transferase